MTRGWCVRVSVFTELVVSISERELAGRDLSEDDEDLIRDCARHLLSFVGEKTPMDNHSAMLRSALVGLVGVDTRAELEELEAVMRLMPAPAQDKAATIDAIHALLATLPESK